MNLIDPRKRYPKSFVWISLLEECQEWGGSWRTGSSLMSWMMFFTLWNIPCKFHVDFFIISMSGMGGQNGGYLEDIEDS